MDTVQLKKILLQSLTRAPSLAIDGACRVAALTNCNARRGIAALPAVIGLSAIILAVGLTIASTGVIENRSSANQRHSQVAFAVALAGLDDAQLRLARNRDYSSAGYGLPISSATATITVEQNQPLSGQVRVTSTGASSGRTRKLQTVLGVDSNGQLTFSTWSELSN